jgi:hypothetical protein
VVLNPTPSVRLTDPQGRPYFLWDADMTLEEFRRALAGSDPAARSYLIGKLMRQAKPDDVFMFVKVSEIRELWDRIERHLGSARPFWSWLLERWKAQDRGNG